MQLHPNGNQRSAQATPERQPWHILTASALYAKELTPQQWIVPSILPAGATLFVGRGKDGKSLLAWNLCLAVATGGTALSTYPVEQGDVLYLALEDGERRAQKRLKDQMQHCAMDLPQTCWSWYSGIPRVSVKASKNNSSPGWTITMSPAWS